MGAVSAMNPVSDNSIDMMLNENKEEIIDKTPKLILDKSLNSKLGLVSHRSHRSHSSHRSHYSSSRGSNGGGIPGGALLIGGLAIGYFLFKSKDE